MKFSRFKQLVVTSIPIILPYLYAFLGATFATGVYYSIREVTSPAVIALLYLLPVGISAALGGLGPSIITALFAFLAFNYYFVVPYYSFFVHNPQDLLALLVLLAVAVLISQLVGQARSNLAASIARERDAVRLYELIVELAGIRDDQAIIEALAKHILVTFQALRVEIMIDSPQNTMQPKLFVCQDREEVGTRPIVASTSHKIVPIQILDRLVGEMCIWGNSIITSKPEERLLSTFVSQGVLALERARLSQAENRAKVLEESDCLKSALLSSISHELRTPLSTIKAAVSGLRSEVIDWSSEARKELLQAMEEETDHLNLLVGNLLNMSRIEAGALNLDRHWNMLAEIVDGVIDRFLKAGDPHHYKIDVQEDLPLVPVDYTLMEQVFSNLISNSSKYSPEDSMVWIKARLLNENEIIVQVSNEGPSVPDEYLERIFEKFFRITEAERVVGTGLGLSICKGIVEAHGGRIWAENLPNGFSFNFVLPISWEGKSVDPHIPQEWD